MRALRFTLPLFIPLISTCLLMLGNGFYSTLISLRLKAAGESDIIIGLLTSVYYLGMLIGSFNLSSVITKIGHIRSFSAFAAVLAVSTIIPGMKQDLILWTIARAIGGYSLAGLYITIESWLLNMSNKHTRGKYIALYMIMLYGGQAGGQLLLGVTDYKTIFPFCLATILIMVAIVPISLMVSSGPQIEEPQSLGFKELYKISPTGIVGCAISGILIASIYGLLPVYLKDIGFDIDSIGALIAVTLFGGVILQYPLGYVSDILDRRIVLVSLCLLGILVCVAMVLASYFLQKNLLFFGLITFIFGGLTFAIYPISMSHTCDFVKTNHIIEATQGMLLAYGIGSVIGPIVTSFFMAAGHQGFFLSFVVVMLIFGTFTTLRMIKGTKTIEATEDNFVSVPHTTPISSELDPRSDE